jgi:hypothetical protein
MTLSYLVEDGFASLNLINKSFSFATESSVAAHSGIWATSGDQSSEEYGILSVEGGQLLGDHAPDAE